MISWEHEIKQKHSIKQFPLFADSQPSKESEFWHAHKYLKHELECISLKKLSLHFIYPFYFVSQYTESKCVIIPTFQTMTDVLRLIPLAGIFKDERFFI